MCKCSFLTEGDVLIGKCAVALLPLNMEVLYLSFALNILKPLMVNYLNAYYRERKPLADFCGGACK